MKIKELRDIGSEELRQKDRELREELFRLRLRHRSGQLETPSALKKIRRDIARIKTVLREREV
ncbi:MAG TPA: 50S ribosomal protein L29 [Syntrophales bacterium]|nr:50S ribosomal protein L29 [Syntrophales bacterium]HOM06775.1 50S ribosomal protein L29 [Syntrophales bacterium]HON99530.1 50S ribosomal protein L29 [Syntrophales bacterium]HPC00735.1 50S ribosomal protein L29 [Syntrophales bacterium]HPQ06067.1 50S ribosomal protein L29 [Syntrophales bacterium]